MGLCASSNGKELTPEERAEQAAAKKLNKATEQQLRKDHNQQLAIRKLLLLGAGESGKSTFFKQLVNFYGVGFSESDRQNIVPIVHSNVLVSMRALCEQSETYGPVAEDLKVHAEQLKGMNGDEGLTEEMAGYIARLWQDEGIRATYDKRAEFHLTDSVDYFFDKVDELWRDEYLPTDGDIMRSRVRTTGIVEADFVVDGHKFKVFDVGGQRNERKKWIHCFEGVTAVLFVAALSVYDQMLYEDETTNRLDEALTLFDEISNSRWFKETTMILFLNKSDLFREKIDRVPLNKFFPEYQGSGFDQGCEFLASQFMAKNKQNRKVVYHVTCATDAASMKKVFDSTTHEMLRRVMESTGFM